MPTRKSGVTKPRLPWELEKYVQPLPIKNAYHLGKIAESKKQKVGVAC